MSNKNRGKKSLAKNIAEYNDNKRHHKSHKTLEKVKKTGYDHSKHRQSYTMPHPGSIQHNQQSKLENMLQKVPIYPIIVGILGIILVSLMFYSQLAPVGYAVADIDNGPYCLKEGRDGFNYKVTDKSECCFLITNTDRCIGPIDAESEYRSIYSGTVEGAFNAKYACYGGSTRKVLFGTTVKNYCNIDI